MPEGQEAMELAVDTLAWVGATALLVSSRLYLPATADADEDEQARRSPFPCRACRACRCGVIGGGKSLLLGVLNAQSSAR